MPATITGELHTVLTAAAFAPLADRAFLRITGPDAPRWLNGMVTNNIQALNPGEGNYNFLLNAQGRIQGDCTIYREPFAKEPSFLLETDTPQIATLHQILDKFIIMDDVELAPALTDRSGLLLVGPGALSLIESLHVGAGAPPHLFEFPSVNDTTKLLLSRHFGTVPAFELFDQGHFDFPAAIEISPATLEALRILEARPRYGTDIRNTDTAKDLPQETNQAHALHFAKGCYLGQEIVERIRSRGQVHRLFTPFRLQGAPPTTFPVPIEANGKAAGELTSAATVPTTAGPVHLALGYARREFLDSHAPLTFPGGTAHPRAAGSLE